VLNNIIKGEGVDNIRREELGSGLKFLTKPLNEGDNEGGLDKVFPDMLELHTDEVQAILEISEVFNTLHRKVHGLAQNCKAEPRGRKECRKKTVDSPSTTVGVITRHDA
jgi:hypothetical protein